MNQTTSDGELGQTRRFEPAPATSA